LFLKKWSGTKQEKNIKIYTTDLFNYFPENLRLDEMQTQEHYEGYVEFCRKQIEARPMNNLSSVSNKSINHRLMLIREMCRFAIKHGMLDQNKLLNPDIRVKHMGWENLPLQATKKKAPLTDEQIQSVYDEAVADGELDFADSFIWLCDTGMRHKTEFDRFTVGDINFKNGTINFYREKTGTWSGDLPLTERCLEIATQRRELAFKRGGKKGRLFLTGYSRRRTLMTRYKDRCKLPEDFKPYATRHTFITRLRDEGVPAEVTMQLAGHTCIETTLTFYAGVHNKNLKQAISKISKPKKVSMIGHNSLKIEE